MICTMVRRGLLALVGLAVFLAPLLAAEPAPPSSSAKGPDAKGTQPPAAKAGEATKAPTTPGEPATPAPKKEEPKTTPATPDASTAPDAKKGESKTTPPKPEEPTTPAAKKGEPKTTSPKPEEPTTPAAKKGESKTTSPKPEEPTTPAVTKDEPKKPAAKPEEPKTSGEAKAVKLDYSSPAKTFQTLLDAAKGGDREGFLSCLDDESRQAMEKTLKMIEDLMKEFPHMKAQLGDGSAFDKVAAEARNTKLDPGEEKIAGKKGTLEILHGDQKDTVHFVQEKESWKMRLPGEIPTPDEVKKQFKELQKILEGMAKDKAPAPEVKQPPSTK